MTLHVWESAGEGADRMEVPGGWIYLVGERDSPAGVFVPYPPGTRHPCSLCGKRIKVGGAMSTHMATCTGELKHQPPATIACSKCSGKYRPNGLAKHEATCPGRPSS